MLHWKQPERLTTLQALSNCLLWNRDTSNACRARHRGNKDAASGSLAFVCWNTEFGGAEVTSATNSYSRCPTLNMVGDCCFSEGWRTLDISSEPTSTPDRVTMPHVMFCASSPGCTLCHFLDCNCSQYQWSAHLAELNLHSCD